VLTTKRFMLQTLPRVLLWFCCRYSYSADQLEYHYTKSKDVLARAVNALLMQKQQQQEQQEEGNAAAAAADMGL
jgi:hypothetical protein